MLLVPWLLSTAVAVPTAVSPPPVTKEVKGLSISVDTAAAHPGGLVVATVRARKAIGPASFALEGRRAPVYPTRGGLRALIPVPLTMPPGPAVLGLEIRGRRGRRRIPIDIEIAPRTYPPPEVLAIPEAKRELLERPERVRDSRLLLSAVRTESLLPLMQGPLRPPLVGAPHRPFGGLLTYEGASFVPMLTDGLYGDHHRGVDYILPVGTLARAPGSGIVLLAQPLTFAGDTLVIDHGRGVVSAFFHLSRIDVAVGQPVEQGAVVAAGGDTGVAVGSHLHWGVYVHGVAVDPQVMEAIDLS
jgi:hypothetical protein